MTRPRYPRSCCSVPFCRRTTTTFPPGHEWVCGEHWRLVDRALKTIRARLVRRWKRNGRWARYQPGDAVDRTLDALWRRMKRQAIERAAGSA
jgi:hypothetical protein